MGVHSSTSLPVTEDEKRRRGDEIAAALCSQGRWRTHGRSIRIADLIGLRLRITNYDEDAELRDAINRYHVLLRMAFEGGNVYKLFETPDAALAMRFNVQVTQIEQAAQLSQAKSVVGKVPCPKCKKQMQIQLDFEPGVPHRPGAVRYPNSGRLPCPACGAEVTLGPVRADLEQKLGKKALDPQPTD
jgi:hypothetical protein